jgi:WD40 repeat protein
MALLAVLFFALPCAGEESESPGAPVLKETARFSAAETALNRVHFSPDGRQLVTANASGEAGLWALSGERIARYAGQRSPMFNAVFSPNGNNLATTGYDGTLREIHLATGDMREFKVHLAAVTDAAYCGGATRLLTGSDDGTACLWDVSATRKLIARSQGPGTVRRVACSDPRRIFASTSDSGYVTVTSWGGQQITRFDTGQNRLNAIAFDGAGAHLLTGSTDGSLKLWTSTGRPVFTVQVQQNGWVNDARFAPGGTGIATASNDGHLRIWSLQGKPLLDLRVTEARLTSVAFSSDGKHVAAATSAGEVVLYEVGE